VGAIHRGLVALIGVTHGDSIADARTLADKTAALRIFADGERAFERTVSEVGGGVLCVSQFTIYGDVRRGNRPSWRNAARPDPAREMVDAYVGRLHALGVPVAAGVFGADMRVTLENDGPVTLVLDSDALRAPRRSPPGAPSPE